MQQEVGAVMHHRRLKHYLGRRQKDAFQCRNARFLFACILLTCTIWIVLTTPGITSREGNTGMHSFLGADHPHDGISAAPNTRKVVVPQDDEMPLEYMPALIHTPFSGFIADRHNVVDDACPRYVTMIKQENGLGHQLGTYTTALITSLFFNLTFVDSPFIDKSVHGDYPGIAVFTGLQHGELLLEDILGKLDKVIEVATMPVTPASTDLQALYAPLRTSFLDTYGAECNVLFKVAEYYSYDYGSFTKRIMAKKFGEAPDRKPVPLIYAANEFVIAVHVRTGDIDPTAESFFVAVLQQILPHLEDVPYRIHVFAEGKGEADYPGIASSVASRDKVVFHPAMPPFETFYHLTQSHVFVMAASGFSQFAALLATKPLVVSPPSRETFPLKFCPPYAVCCDKDGRFEMEGILRLHRRKERWLASQLQTVLI